MSEKEPNIEEEVLSTLLETWSKFPKLRLTQIIVNAIAPSKPCPEIFYVEDSQLIKKLKKYKNNHY